jgi:UDP-N-acetylglucosamine:LPS N-acetylglucosamine transferase
LLEKISAATESCPFILWVEPALYTNEMPRWIQPASFTPAMYSRLTAVVTRPGVGTLTEALLAGSRLFLFHESTNSEMVFNAKRIQESNLGEVFANPEYAWLAAVSYVKLAEPKSTIPNPIPPLNFEGAKQAAKLIVESA